MRLFLLLVMVTWAGPVLAAGSEEKICANFQGPMCLSCTGDALTIQDGEMKGGVVYCETPRPNIYYEESNGNKWVCSNNDEVEMTNCEPAYFADGTPTKAMKKLLNPVKDRKSNAC